MNQKQKEAQVLSDAARIVRSVAGERDAALAKVAEQEQKLQAYERQAHAEKVAALMHQKGISTDIEYPQLVSDLLKSAQEGKLDTIEEAVQMVAPNMSLKTASIHDSPTAGATAHDFERYLLGNIG